MAVVEVNHLTKRYGGRVVVDDLSFAVEEGEIFGIVGPNGAGKTTTVESIVGMRTPDGGTIRVLDLDPHRDRQRVRELVGVQLQESQLPDRLTVAEALDLYASFYRAPADWRQLVVELGLEDSSTTAFAKLSGGQKQRLSVALALVGRPTIAVLDELTTGLDPKARRDAWGLIEQVRSGGVTILLVTHFMEEAERLCDRVAIVDRGRLVALDTPAGIVSRVSTDQRIRFRSSTPIDEHLLRGLPDVTDVATHGDQTVVTGQGRSCTPSCRCWPATRPT
jgi:ABC-2 type transport system ATP-binding protein